MEDGSKHTESKLSSKLSVKDETTFKKQQNLLYRAACPIDNCTKDYLGKTAWPVVERVKDLNGRDQGYPKEPFGSGEEWLCYTRKWLKK